MFLYKNHRLHIHRVSFQIPDGYYLDSKLHEDTDHLLRLRSPQMDYSVEIRLDADCCGAEQEMHDIIKDLAPDVICPPEAVVVGGLPGYHAKYRTRRDQYYELWLDLEPGVALCVLVETKGEILAVDVETLLKSIDLRTEK